MNALQKLKVWFKSRIEDFKAWRRGETRIAPDGCRGRVFAQRPKRGPGKTGDNHSKGVVNVEMQIHRADGTVERRVVSGKAYKTHEE